MKIFLVDKNHSVRGFFEDFFNEFSHDVYQFKCAEHALCALRSMVPDIIISGARFASNYEVETIDGMEFLKICRKDIKYSGHFYIMTSYPAYRPEEYLKNGANYFFDKNAGYGEILALLEKILSSEEKIQTIQSLTKL